MRIRTGSYMHARSVQLHLHQRAEKQLHLHSSYRVYQVSLRRHEREMIACLPYDVSAKT